MLLRLKLVFLIFLWYVIKITFVFSYQFYSLYTIHLSHTALLQVDHKASAYLSPNYSLKEAWTDQRPMGGLKQL